ncbi:MAG: PAS domain-containing sensor histidine kinase, partial [Verrucomicrobia bacterium]|nr:PAS domain-containing sensor histidine kinase [Verrucomicrobiota bacterium]
MPDEDIEMTRPKLPDDLTAIGALLQLARAFLPSFDLSTATKPADSAPKAQVPVAEVRYKTLVEQLPAATFMASLESGQAEMYVSSYIEMLLGYTAAEWIEDPILWYQRLHPDDRARWNEDFARTILAAEPFKGDYRFLAKDGRVVWIHGEVQVVRDETGQLAFIHGIGYDITALKRIEEELRRARDEAERASHAKSEFLSRTSHELRTPLHSIIGFAEFILEGMPGPLSPKQREFIEEIYTSGNHLLRLINEVLDLTKIEAGKMEIRPERFSLQAAVEEVFSTAMPIAQKRGIRIAVEVAPEIGEVTLDQQKFKQILFNLLSNAIKFTKKGGNVWVRAELHDARCFKLAVEDTGIGIKPENLPRLFQEFEQLDSGLSRRYEGTGLGLALTKSFVELQGGTVGVESTYGQGSTFSVVLPRHNPAAP